MATLTHLSDRRLAIGELDKSIVNLSARINASTYELLVLIREFDERGGWLNASSRALRRPRESERRPQSG